MTSILWGLQLRMRERPEGLWINASSHYFRFVSTDLPIFASFVHFRQKPLSPKQFYSLMTQHVHHCFHLPLTIVLHQLNELLRPSPHLKQNRRNYIARWVVLFLLCFCFVLFYGFVWLSPVAYRMKEDNTSFANSPLKSNGGLTKLGLTSLVRETPVHTSHILRQWTKDCHASARFPAAYWCRFCNLSNNSYSSNVYTYT